MKTSNTSIVLSAIAIVLILANFALLMSWDYERRDCPETIVMRCDRIHCGEVGCEPVIIRDSIPCPPIPVVTKPCDSAIAMIPIPIPKRCEPDTIKVKVPFPVPTPGPERIVYKDSIRYVNTIIKDTVYKPKNNLYLYASVSAYCFNEDGGEWSTGLKQLGLDYTVKDKWIFGVSLAHVDYKQRDNYYSDVQTTSSAFRNSTVTEKYSHSTFAVADPGEPCTVETQYIERLTTEYYDRTKEVPYFINPLDNFYINAKVGIRLF